MGIEVRAQEKNPNIKVVSLSGRLDITAAETAAATFTEALDQSGVGIIVDLGQLDFISSAGLRILLAIRKKSDAVHKKIALVRAHPTVYKIFKVSALDKVFQFFEDEAEAVQTVWP